MRETSKPSTAQCNLEHYTLFLLSEPKHGGCSRLAEILGDVSHDSVNRFLLRERYEPKDLFAIVKEIINGSPDKEVISFCYIRKYNIVVTVHRVNSATGKNK